MLADKVARNKDERHTYGHSRKFWTNTSRSGMLPGTTPGCLTGSLMAAIANRRVNDQGLIGRTNARLGNLDAIVCTTGFPYRGGTNHECSGRQRLVANDKPGRPFRRRIRIADRVGIGAYIGKSVAVEAFKGLGTSLKVCNGVRTVGVLNISLIAWVGDSGNNADDSDHNHDLDQRETW